MKADEIEREKLYLIIDKSGKLSARMVDEIWGTPPRVSWHEVSFSFLGQISPCDAARGTCDIKSFARWAKKRIDFSPDTPEPSTKG